MKRHQGPDPTHAKALPLTSTLLAAATAWPAFAAAPPADVSAQVEEVIVTGSRGKPRTIVSSPAPIDVIGGDQISALAGSSPLRDALTQLIPSFQAQTVGSSSWDSLARPAGLRGLGGVHVLVPANDQHYGAKWVTDLEVGYQVNDRVNVAVGANNLFNVYPDKNTVPDTNGFAPYGGNSPFGIYGGYYYGRVSVAF